MMGCLGAGRRSAIRESGRRWSSRNRAAIVKQVLERTGKVRDVQLVLLERQISHGEHLGRFTEFKRRPQLVIIASQSLLPVRVEHKRERLAHLVQRRARALHVQGNPVIPGALDRVLIVRDGPVSAASNETVPPHPNPIPHRVHL